MLGGNVRNSSAGDRAWLPQLLQSVVATKQLLDPWRFHIECHVCSRSYSAIEMDRDPSHNQEAICTGCAEGNAAFLQAVKIESDGMVGQRSDLAT